MASCNNDDNATVQLQIVIWHILIKAEKPNQVCIVRSIYICMFEKSVFCAKKNIYRIGCVVALYLL